MASENFKGSWILCLICGCFVVGCGSRGSRATSDTEQTRQAILQVMQADKQLCNKLRDAKPGITPSQLVNLVGAYCNGLERLDMSACPPDFRIAYKHHVRAWRKIQLVINRLPGGFLDAFVMGFLNGLRGELDGGQSRLENALRQAQERIDITWEEVERIAAKYGAVV